MCVFNLVLAYVSLYIFVCICICICMCVYIYIYVCVCVLVCVCVRQGVHICVTVSMCRRGVVVSCVLVCRRPWMLSRLQLGTAMVHVQCSKSKPPTSRMAIHWRHQPSPWPAAAWAAGWWNRLLTRASCLAVSQNRNYKVFSGSSEYLLFSDELLYIYIYYL